MSSKIKVLQVIPKLGYGGAESGCYDFAHYLTENNCSSYIVTSGGELLKYIDKKNQEEIMDLILNAVEEVAVKNDVLMIRGTSPPLERDLSILCFKKRKYEFENCQEKYNSA